MCHGKLEGQNLLASAFEADTVQAPYQTSCLVQADSAWLPGHVQTFSGLDHVSYMAASAP